MAYRLLRWADATKDTFGWLGNKTQQELFSPHKKSREEASKKPDGELLTKWRHLTTSDQLYFAHESSGSDHAVHSYFSPYGSIGEAARIITDKIWEMEKSIDTFYILKKTEKTPVIIISPETDKLPTEGMGEFAKYVTGKSGGMGEVVAALCRGPVRKGYLDLYHHAESKKKIHSEIGNEQRRVYGKNVSPAAR